VETLQIGEYLVTFDRNGGDPTVRFQQDLVERLTIPGRVLAEMQPPAGEAAKIGRDGQSVSLTADELAALRQAYREWTGLPVLGADDVALITDAEIVLADGSVVPIVKDHWPDGTPFQWADERQWCKRVHEALDGKLDEAACAALRAGCGCWKAWPDGRKGCTLTSSACTNTYEPCLFDEPRGSKGWAKAKRWVSVTVDGVHGLTLAKE